MSGPSPPGSRARGQGRSATRGADEARLGAARGIRQPLDPSRSVVAPDSRAREQRPESFTSTVNETEWRRSVLCGHHAVKHAAQEIPVANIYLQPTLLGNSSASALRGQAAAVLVCWLATQEAHRKAVPGRHVVSGPTHEVSLKEGYSLLAGRLSWICQHSITIISKKKKPRTIVTS